MQRRAFTLLEALAVIIVLAIIAAILFPIFARSRENDGHRSPGSGCQNNMKQMALGFKQYINDFDERYPMVVVTRGSSKGIPPYGWADALQPYIKNTQVYQCPSDNTEGDDDPTKPNYCDFWYNANFIRKIPRGSTAIITGANESMLGSSAQTVLAGDGGNTNGAPTGSARYNQCGDGTALTAATQTCPVAPAGTATLPTAQIHLEGANYAFADGHVKWLKGGSATRCEMILSNGMAQKTIKFSPYEGKATLSLLNAVQ
jgi:prepilin-type processing-associated H-X9-DG protein/prepilin-type N-terminal cleavage/methylation domain-containing protein